MKKAVTPKGSHLRPAEAQKLTMTEVAKYVGVSAMTVSRAFRQDASVSEETRKRIMDAVDALGYVLDQSAGSLSSRRTGFIAALVPSINNSNFSDTARGITDALDNTGLQLLLGYTDYSAEKEEHLIESMLRRRPEGIISPADRTRPGTPDAGKCRYSRGRNPASRKPINYVVGFPRRAASFWSGSWPGKGSREVRLHRRNDGAIPAAATPQRLLRPRGAGFNWRVIPGAADSWNRRQAVVSMLERWPDTEVVLCVSDLSAFGALMECKRRGMRVPEDIAIAGFGDYEISSICHPRITTINADCYGIGRQAAARLLDALQNGGGAGDEITLTSYRVVLREST